MTIRFGNRIRLASRDRERLREITLCDPGNLKSFDALFAFLKLHRAKVRGVSEDARFLRWVMDREWNRLSSGAGYAECASKDRCRHPNLPQ